MRTRARSIAGALALLTAFALSGCGAVSQPVVTRLPTDGSPSSTTSPTSTRSATPVPRPTASIVPGPTTAPSGSAADGTDCGGAEKLLAGSSQAFALSGECPVVRIEGNALTVDALGATVGAVTLSGDRIRLDATAVGDTTLQGNDMTVNAGSAGVVTIRGDRNTVTATGGSTRVVFSGNDNVVIAPSADIVDDGQRNTVR